MPPIYNDFTRGVPGSAWSPTIDLDMRHQVAAQQGMAKDKNAADLAAAQIGADASRYPHQLRQDRFNAVFPELQRQMNATGQTAMSTAGGASGTGPTINSNPIWNPQSLQQQINASRATTDQGTATQINNMQGSLAGRGFGTNSPLAQALTAQYQGQGLAANVGNERQARMTAAQGNATQQLQSQTAREGQFASRQQEDIERRKPYFAQQNALLAALTSLAG